MAKAKGRAAKPKIGFVLDNSIVMAWSFEDESDDYADAALDRLATLSAIVPALWPLEVANALLMGERRKRSTPTFENEDSGALVSIWCRWGETDPTLAGRFPAPARELSSIGAVSCRARLAAKGVLFAVIEGEGGSHTAPPRLDCLPWRTSGDHGR